jgi:hypothetical protein
MQEKVRLLAGGTNGVELAQVILDREDELREKDVLIAQLNADLDAFDADRAEYTVNKILFFRIKTMCLLNCHLKYTKLACTICRE